LRLAGLELHERHRELLGQRTRRLGIQDRAGLEALLNAADDGDQAAGRRLIGLLRTNFTGFFGIFTRVQLARIEARSRFVAETQIGSFAALGNISWSFLLPCLKSCR
jgi:hypothetical protein